MTEATHRRPHTSSLASSFLEFDLISEVDRLRREARGTLATMPEH
jgi:hypothetical protein